MTYTDVLEKSDYT